MIYAGPNILSKQEDNEADQNSKYSSMNFEIFNKREN